MKNTLAPVMAVVAMPALVLGAGFPQAPRPATTWTATAVPRASDESYASSAAAWVKRDTGRAARSVAATATYVRHAVLSAVQAAEMDPGKGLKAVESFSGTLANKMKARTEQAWSTTAHAVRRAIARAKVT